VIRVRDQGRGISEDALARIFEGFYRTDFAATEKGSGLGLYVCREIIRAMGGSLEAKSKIWEGSEFIVCIPRFQKDKTE
jgi:signal transduction histidine kinase